MPERSFGKWVSACCGFTDRSARNYVAVHRRLGSYRDRLAGIGASPTVLFELTRAEPDQIDRALDVAAETGRLQVKDVKKIVLADRPLQPKPEIDPFEIGGIEGLGNLMRIKIRDGLKSFEKHVAAIIRAVQDALTQRAKGKRIVKEVLSEDIKMTARYAVAELCNLALPVAPNPAVQVRIEQATHFPRTSEWETVRALLWDLGDKDRWPAATELPAWLENRVLPTLRWAIFGIGYNTSEAKPALKPIESKPTNVVVIEPRPKTTLLENGEAHALGLALDRAFQQAAAKTVEIQTK